MEHPVPVRLGHLGVDVVAGVPKLGDLLRQQLHSLCRVAEDDALIDLKFAEESVEAMNLKKTLSFIVNRQFNVLFCYSIIMTLRLTFCLSWTKA